MAYALLQSRCDEDRNMTAFRLTHRGTGRCSKSIIEPYIDSKVDQGSGILGASLKPEKPGNVRAQAHTNPKVDVVK